MRNFTFKGLFLTAVFMLLGCLSIQAANDDLITKQITIKLDEAGTLPDKIGSSRMYKITNLKIVGKIDGTDWDMIRMMAGRDYHGDVTKGNLSVLDLSEAKIVNGGGYYYYYDYDGWSYRYGTYYDKIGDYAFKGCSGLTSLTLPATITTIGKYAFEDCTGLTSLNLPAGITSIGRRAFGGCSGLTSLTLPAGITSISDYAFYGCSGLTSLTLPAGITSIGEFAFSYCSGLTSIYVYAEKVPRIGRYAFEGCASRKCTLYVPKGTYDNYRLSEFGYFENIVEFDATGIDKTTTSTDVEEVSRYSLNGQRLAVPVKGLNIVKYSDGTARKVVVK